MCVITHIHMQVCPQGNGQRGAGRNGRAAHERGATGQGRRPERLSSVQGAGGQLEREVHAPALLLPGLQHRHHYLLHTTDYLLCSPYYMTPYYYSAGLQHRQRHHYSLLTTDYLLCTLPTLQAFNIAIAIFHNPITSGLDALPARETVRSSTLTTA